jgi:hypothetical protein
MLKQRKNALIIIFLNNIFIINLLCCSAPIRAPASIWVSYHRKHHPSD